MKRLTSFSEVFDALGTIEELHLSLDPLLTEGHVVLNLEFSKAFRFLNHLREREIFPKYIYVFGKPPQLYMTYKSLGGEGLGGKELMR